MVSREQNELLTRVGPGSPCGEMIRRYWQPAALSDELPPGGAPLPLRLLGEDLVLLRDETGQPGLLGLHCAHRGADLSYGRLEDGGLRCIYHGWLYDRAGRCLEQPGEPAGSTFHERIRQKAYPCAEVGGLILAYLGPGSPPLVPAYEFLHARPEMSFATKLFQDCNFLQGNEGNLDPQHTPFLHRLYGLDDDSHTYFSSSGTFPSLEVEDTAFGFRMCRTRSIDPDTDYIILTYFVLPNFAAFSGVPNGYSVNWHVPIDDTHHWKYSIQFGREIPVNPTIIEGRRTGVTADYRPKRNKANRYLQSREELKTFGFAGLGSSFYDHDTCATEGEGPILDRTQEHLGFTDRGVIAMRSHMLGAIKDVQKGLDPPGVVRDPASNRFPELVVASGKVHTGDIWRQHWGEIPTAAGTAERSG